MQQHQSKANAWQDDIDIRPLFHVIWAPILERVWAKTERDPRENVFENMFEIWAKFKPNLCEILTEFLTELLSF